MALIVGWGWRGAYLFLAFASLLGGICTQLLMRPSSERASSPMGVQRDAISSAVRQPRFWHLAGAVLLVSAGSLGLVTQLQPALLSRGLDVRATASFMSLLAISVMISRLVVGRFLDRTRPE